MWYAQSMRTTIELDDEHRARLMELAARRRLKGYSLIVQEAVDQYLKRGVSPAPGLKEFRKLRGSVSREQAEHLRSVASRVRASWR